MNRIADCTPKRKRVVVVDDSKTMQAVLEQIFSLRLRYDVVGLADDALSAANLIRSLKPDLVTIDLRMPYIDGRQLLDMIADLPDVRKVIISGQACDNLAMVSSLEAAGADACIDKKNLARDPAKFCNTILAVLSKPTPRRTVAKAVGRPITAPAPLPSAFGAYPIPLDERARLAALVQADLANDTADYQLDLLTRHLGVTTDFPTALVTFIDRDRQWVKSAHGFARGSMPRALAFCNYTLCSDETFIVSNATTDPRFSANSLVTGEPRIRTYVGHPILAEDSVRIGAICLIDSKPRLVTPDVISNLRSICDIAAEIIKLRAPMNSKAA